VGAQDLAPYGRLALWTHFDLNVHKEEERGKKGNSDLATNDSTPREGCLHAQHSFYTYL